MHHLYQVDLAVQEHHVVPLVQVVLELQTLPVDHLDHEVQMGLLVLVCLVLQELLIPQEVQLVLSLRWVLYHQLGRQLLEDLPLLVLLVLLVSLAVRLVLVGLCYLVDQLHLMFLVLLLVQVGLAVLGSPV